MTAGSIRIWTAEIWQGLCGLVGYFYSKARGRHETACALRIFLHFDSFASVNSATSSLLCKSVGTGLSATPYLVEDLGGGGSIRR
jgi:hypothetical protein